MEHVGGCHCGNLNLRLTLTRPPADYPTRSCGCSFCRAHATRTVSDPGGRVDIRANDWSRVERYRFGTGTAEFLLCRTCGVYIGAVCDTEQGLRAVTNVNSLADRAAFPPASSFPDHDEETVEARLERRAANWTPAIVLGV
jgi:hypothetical protein